VDHHRADRSATTILRSEDGTVALSGFGRSWA
jgi:hypothetical protein